MSPDDVTNSTVVLVLNTDEWSDRNSETFQWDYTKYKHSWYNTHPVKLVDES